MKIMISDYPDSMMPSHDYEIRLLKSGLPNAKIIVYEYDDHKRADFLDKIADVDVLLTAFIKVDESVFNHAKQLKQISLNATGFDNIDLQQANLHHVAVSPVGEYCTHDVAEHTIALMLALNKNLKAYSYNIEKNYQWSFNLDNIPYRIEEQTLGIFGFGKIGKRVALLAKGLGMTVIAHDIAINKEEANKYGVELVTADEIYYRADVITNHMNLLDSNLAYFTEKEFAQMRNQPIFLNLGRGLSVDEGALIDALDNKKIRGAGLDVLKDETPSLKHHPLVGRDNVIITPHSAFYSVNSMTDLQRISCENIIHYMNGHKEKVYKLVNDI